MTDAKAERPGVEERKGALTKEQQHNLLLDGLCHGRNRTHPYTEGCAGCYKIDEAITLVGYIPGLSEFADAPAVDLRCTCPYGPDKHARNCALMVWRDRVAWKRVRAFIADELECRESSMMPPSDDDARYIASAKEALRAADQIGIYMGRQGGRSNG
jgi:hypothetical protein